MGQSAVNRMNTTAVNRMNATAVSQAVQEPTRENVVVRQPPIPRSAVSSVLRFELEFINDISNLIQEDT